MRVLGSNCFRMAFESGLAWFLHQFESPSLSRTLSFVGTAMDAALGLAALAVTEDVVLKEVRSARGLYFFLNSNSELCDLCFGHHCASNQAILVKYVVLMKLCVH